MEQAELYHDFDQKVRGYMPTGPTDDTVMLLEQMFKHLPSEGKQNLADDVVGFAGEKRPPRTQSLLVDDDDSFEQQLNANMIDDPIAWEQLRFRKDCCRRNGDMCVLSKDFNTRSKHIPSGKETMYLELARVLPLSLGDFSQKFWNCLYRYFPGVRTHVNIGPKPTKVPSLYRVKTFSGFATACNRFLPEDGLVTLTLHDTRYALPHPILLETHYILATIFHATGRVERVNSILEDYRDTCGLAKDGSTDIDRLLSIILSSAVDHDREIM